MEEQWIFKISFINVGNGDAILVQVKDQDYRSGCFVMVVDAFTHDAPGEESQRVYLIARECQKNKKEENV